VKDFSSRHLMVIHSPSYSTFLPQQGCSFWIGEDPSSLVPQAPLRSCADLRFSIPPILDWFLALSLSSCVCSCLSLNVSPSYNNSPTPHYCWNVPPEASMVLVLTIWSISFPCTVYSIYRFLLNGYLRLLTPPSPKHVEELFPAHLLKIFSSV